VDSSQAGRYLNFLENVDIGQSDVVELNSETLNQMIGLPILLLNMVADYSGDKWNHVLFIYIINYNEFFLDCNK
jgi:hypothetical protein